MMSTKIFAAIVFGSAIVAAPAFAATTAPVAPPQSHCITTTTIALHTGFVATEKKDVAPYLNTEAMDGAIQIYEQGIETAWSAMEGPYCGYGAFGAASAIHSFQKTAERLRTAFMDHVAQFRATGKAPAAPLVVTPTPTTEPTQEVVAPIVVTPSPAKSVSRVVTLRGLHEGMRSEDVRQLQLLIAKHFNISTDDPYITGYFGAMTKKRVIRFQIEKGIIANENTPGAGLIGPKTFAAVSALE